MSTCMELEDAIKVLSDETRICAALMNATAEDDQRILAGRNLVREHELRGRTVDPGALRAHDAASILEAAVLVKSVE